MQDIELDGSQPVDRALDSVDRDEVAGNVQRKAAPGKARLVADLGERHRESGRGVGAVRRVLMHKLQEGFEAAQDTERTVSRKTRA